MTFVCKKCQVQGETKENTHICSTSSWSSVNISTNISVIQCTKEQWCRVVSIISLKAIIKIMLLNRIDIFFLHVHVTVHVLYKNLWQKLCTNFHSWLRVATALIIDLSFRSTFNLKFILCWFVHQIYKTFITGHTIIWLLFPLWLNCLCSIRLKNIALSFTVL